MQAASCLRQVRAVRGPKEHGVGRGKSDFKTQEAGERTGWETQVNFNRGKALPLTRGDENGIYLCGLPPQSL